MRLYGHEGRFIENPADTEFGWTLDSAPHPPISLLEPRVITESALNSVSSFRKPEGIVDEQQIFSTETPSQHQLSNLINPCTLESKTLLSIVYFAKYKTLSGLNVDDLDVRISGMTEDKMKTCIRKEIDNVRKDNSVMLSLLMELILAEIDGDLTDFVRSNSNERCDIAKNTPCQNSFDRTTDKNIKRICQETHEMHLQIEDIRQSFNEDLERVEKLILEAQTLHKSLKETVYLENIIHLLEGDMNRVHSEKWPFRVCHKPIWNTDNINLII